MRITNPLTFEYEHPNFNGQKLKVSLNQNPVINQFLELKAEMGNKTASCDLQFQDNGTIIIRNHVDPAGIFRFLLVDHSGTLFSN